MARKRAMQERKHKRERTGGKIEKSKFDKGAWENERVGKHDKGVKGLMNRERKKENWMEIEKERDL